MAGVQYKINIQADASAAQRQVEQLSASLQRLQSNSRLNLQIDTNMADAAQQAAKLQQALQQAVNVNTGQINFTTLSNSLQSANTNVQTLINSFQRAGTTGQQAISQLSSVLTQATIPAQKATGIIASFGTTLMNTIKWQAASQMVHGLQSAIGGAVSYIENLNTSLTNIRVVTGKSVKDMGNFAKEANVMAKSLSTSTKAYADAALIYYQQGDNDKDVQKKAQITLKAANTAFKANAQEMSEMLTAVWNSYKAGGDELEGYVDIMAKLGSTTATSMEEIATALQKVAATASTVGVGMEQMSSIVATVSSVTRESAESIGTSFKTILARMGDLKLGETLEDGVNLGKVSGQLSQIGVSVLDATGNMRDMGDVITDLGNKWQTMGSAQKTAIAQVVAGKRQYTQLMALFENWDTYQKDLRNAQNSAGSLEKMQKTYEDSVKASKQRVQASKEAIFGDLIDDQFIVKFNNALATALQAVRGLVNGLGGIPGILAKIGSMMMTAFKPQMLDKLTNGFMAVGNFFGKGGTVRTAWRGYTHQNPNATLSGIPTYRKYDKFMRTNPEYSSMTGAMNDYGAMKFAQGSQQRNLFNNLTTLRAYSAQNYNTATDRMEELSTQGQTNTTAYTQASLNQQIADAQNQSVVSKQDLLLRQGQISGQEAARIQAHIDYLNQRQQTMTGHATNLSNLTQEAQDNLTIGSLVELEGEHDASALRAHALANARNYYAGRTLTEDQMKIFRGLGSSDTGKQNAAIRALGTQVEQEERGNILRQGVRSQIDQILNPVDEAGANSAAERFDRMMREDSNNPMAKAVRSILPDSDTLDGWLKDSGIDDPHSASSAQRGRVLAEHLAGRVEGDLHNAYDEMSSIVGEDSSRRAQNYGHQIGQEEVTTSFDLANEEPQNGSDREESALKLAKGVSKVAEGAMAAVQGLTSMRGIIESFKSGDTLSGITSIVSAGGSLINTFMTQGPLMAGIQAAGMAIAGIFTYLQDQQEKREQQMVKMADTTNKILEEHQQQNQELMDNSNAFDSLNKQFEEGALSVQEYSSALADIASSLGIQGAAVMALTGNYQGLTAAIQESIEAAREQQIETAESDVRRAEHGLENQAVKIAKENMGDKYRAKKGNEGNTNVTTGVVYDDILGSFNTNMEKSGLLASLQKSSVRKMLADQYGINIDATIARNAKYGEGQENDLIQAFLSGGNTKAGGFGTFRTADDLIIDADLDTLLGYYNQLSAIKEAAKTIEDPGMKSQLETLVHDQSFEDIDFMITEMISPYLNAVKSMRELKGQDWLKQQNVEGWGSDIQESLVEGLLADWGIDSSKNDAITRAAKKQAGQLVTTYARGLVGVSESDIAAADATVSNQESAVTAMTTRNKKMTKAEAQKKLESWGFSDQDWTYMTNIAPFLDNNGDLMDKRVPKLLQQQAKAQTATGLLAQWGDRYSGDFDIDSFAAQLPIVSELLGLGDIFDKEAWSKMSSGEKVAQITALMEQINTGYDNWWQQYENGMVNLKTIITDSQNAFMQEHMGVQDTKQAKQRWEHQRTFQRFLSENIDENGKLYNTEDTRNTMLAMFGDKYATAGSGTDILRAYMSDWGISYKGTVNNNSDFRGLLTSLSDEEAEYNNITTALQTAEKFIEKASGKSQQLDWLSGAELDPTKWKETEVAMNQLLLGLNQTDTPSFSEWLGMSDLDRDLYRIEQMKNKLKELQALEGEEGYDGTQVQIQEQKIKALEAQYNEAQFNLKKNTLQAQDTDTDTKIDAAKNAISFIASNLDSLDNLSFDSIAQLEQYLVQAGVAAERVRQLIEDIQNAGNDKEKIRAGMVAATEAALNQIGALEQKKAEYEGLVTKIEISEDVEKPTVILDANADTEQAESDLQAAADGPYTAEVNVNDPNTDPTKAKIEGAANGPYQATVQVGENGSGDVIKSIKEVEGQPGKYKAIIQSASDGSEKEVELSFNNVADGQYIAYLLANGTPAFLVSALVEGAAKRATKDREGDLNLNDDGATDTAEGVSAAADDATKGGTGNLNLKDNGATTTAENVSAAADDATEGGTGNLNLKDNGATEVAENVEGQATDATQDRTGKLGLKGGSALLTASSVLAMAVAATTDRTGDLDLDGDGAITVAELTEKTAKEAMKGPFCGIINFDPKPGQEVFDVVKTWVWDDSGTVTMTVADGGDGTTKGSTIKGTVQGWIKGTGENGEHQISVVLATDDNGVAVLTQEIESIIPDEDDPAQIHVKFANGTETTLPADLQQILDNIDETTKESGYEVNVRTLLIDTIMQQLQKEYPITIKAKVQGLYGQMASDYWKDENFKQTSGLSGIHAFAWNPIDQRDYKADKITNEDRIKLAQFFDPKNSKLWNPDSNNEYGYTGFKQAYVEAMGSRNWSHINSGTIQNSPFGQALMKQTAELISGMTSEELSNKAIQENIIEPFEHYLLYYANSNDAFAQSFAAALYEGIYVGLCQNPDIDFSAALNASNVKEAIEAAFKAMLEINSPSKITMRLAPSLFEGLQVGMDQGAASFQPKVSGLGAKLLLAFLTEIEDARQGINDGVKKLFDEVTFDDENSQAIWKALSESMLNPENKEKTPYELQSEYIQSRLENPLVELQQHPELYSQMLAAEKLTMVQGQLVSQDDVDRYLKDNNLQSDDTTKIAQNWVSAHSIKTVSQQLQDKMQAILRQTVSEVYNTAMTDIFDKNNNNFFKQQNWKSDMAKTKYGLTDRQQIYIDTAIEAALAATGIQDLDALINKIEQGVASEKEQKQYENFIEIAQKTLDKNGQDLELAIDEAWSKIKGIWQQGLEAILESERAAAQAVLELWEQTFEAISEMRAGLAEGKTILETMFGNPEELAAYVQSLLLAGKTLEEIKSHLTDPNAQVNYTPWDFTNYRLSGKQQFLNYDQETQQFKDTDVAAYNQNVDDYVNQLTNQELLPILQKTITSDYLSSLNQKAQSGDSNAIATLTALEDFLTEDRKALKKEIDLNNSEVVTGVRNALRDTLHVTDSSEVAQIMSEAIVEQWRQNSRLEQAAKEQGEQIIDKKQEDYDLIKKAQQSLLKNKDLSDLTETEKKTLTDNLVEMGLLEKGASSAAIGLDTLQNAAITLGSVLANLASQLMRAMKDISEGRATNFRIDENGNVETEKSINIHSKQEYEDAQKANFQIGQTLEQLQELATKENKTLDEYLLNHPVVGTKRTQLGTEAVTEDQAGKAIANALHAETQISQEQIDLFRNELNMTEKEMVNYLESLAGMYGGQINWNNATEAGKAQLAELAYEAHQSEDAIGKLTAAVKEGGLFDKLAKGELTPQELMDSYQQLTDIVNGFFKAGEVDQNFVKEHLAEIKEWANGSTEAMERLEKAIINEQISAAQGVEDFEKSSEKAAEVLKKINEMGNDLKFGDFLSVANLRLLKQIQKELGLTDKAMDEILDTMGFVSDYGETVAKTAQDMVKNFGGLDKANKLLEGTGAQIEQVGNDFRYVFDNVNAATSMMQDFGQSTMEIDVADALAATGDTMADIRAQLAQQIESQGIEIPVDFDINEAPIIAVLDQQGVIHYMLDIPDLQLGEQVMGENQIDLQAHGDVVVDGKTVSNAALNLHGTGPTVMSVPQAQNSRGSSAGGGGGKKGGGGGGGGNKAKKGKSKAEIPRYHEVDQSIKRYDAKLDQVGKKEEIAFGATRVKLMREELEKLNKQMDNYQERLNEATAYASADRANVEGLAQQLGITLNFDEDGTISNWEALQEKMIDWYNEHRNDKPKDGMESPDDVYSRMQKVVEDYESSLEQVEEYQNKILEYQHKISEQIADTIEATHEWKIELADVELELLEGQLERIEEIFTNLGSRAGIMAEALFGADGVGFDGFSFMKLNEELQKLNELQNAFNSGKIDSATFAERTQEIMSTLNDDMTDIYDKGQEIQELFQNLWDAYNDELTKNTDLIDQNIAALEALQKISDILGAHNTYAQTRANLTEQYNQTARLADIHRTSYETMTQELQKYHDQITALGATIEGAGTDWQKGWDALDQKQRDDYKSLMTTMQEMQNTYYENLTTMADLAKQRWEADVEEIGVQLDHALAMGESTLDYLQGRYDRDIEVQERFLNTAHQLYNINKLNRQIEQSLADTTDKALKDQYEALQNVINEKAKSGQLTQYDTDMMQKQYELLEKQAALRDAQNAKDTVRLTRDENGNYMYQYTADQDKVDEATQQYNDVLIQINELSLNRVQELEEQMLEKRKWYVEQAKAIALDDLLSETEKADKLKELQLMAEEDDKYFVEQMQQAYSDLTINNAACVAAYGDAVDAAFNDPTEGINPTIRSAIALQDSMATALTEAIGDDTSGLIARLHDLSHALDESLYRTGLSTMSDFNDIVGDATRLATSEVITLNDNLVDEAAKIDAVTAAWYRQKQQIEELFKLIEHANTENLQLLWQVGSTIGDIGTPTSTGFMQYTLVPVQSNTVGYTDGTVAGSNSSITTTTSSSRSSVSDSLLNKLRAQGYKFASGGLADYTGPAWVDGSPNKPELMLNATDTPNLLNTVDALRSIDVTAVQNLLGFIGGLASAMSGAGISASGANILSGMGGLEQNVHISAEFPNATDRNEIIAAFDELNNRASQFINNYR